MKLTLTVVVIIAIVCTTHLRATLAETPFFWDDFDRSDPCDTDIQYSVDEPPAEEEVTLLDGSAWLVPLEREYPAIWLSDVAFDRVRMETSFHFVDAPNDGTPLAYLIVDENTGEASDWADVSVAGRMIPGVGVDGTSVWDQSLRLAPYRTMANNDIHIVVEFGKDEHSVTTWLDR